MQNHLKIIFSVSFLLALCSACGGRHHEGHGWPKNHHHHHWLSDSAQNLWTGSDSITLKASDNGFANESASVPCSPGDEFYALACARTAGMTEGLAHIWFSFYSDKNEEIGLGKALPDGTPEFTSSEIRTQIGAMGVAPVGATKVSCFIECVKCNPGATVSFDSISLTKGSED